MKVGSGERRGLFKNYDTRDKGVSAEVNFDQFKSATLPKINWKWCFARVTKGADKHWPKNGCVMSTEPSETLYEVDKCPFAHYQKRAPCIPVEFHKRAPNYQRMEQVTCSDLSKKLRSVTLLAQKTYATFPPCDRKSAQNISSLHVELEWPPWPSGLSGWTLDPASRVRFPSLTSWLGFPHCPRGKYTHGH